MHARTHTLTHSVSNSVEFERLLYNYTCFPTVLGHYPQGNVGGVCVTIGFQERAVQLMCLEPKL